MSRLIDADVVEKMLRSYADEVGCHRGEYELANGILKSVCYLENIPTAYDPDKVVEELSNYLFEEYCIEDDSEIYEIVKGGGVSG